VVSLALTWLIVALDISALLMISLSYFPPTSPYLKDLANSPQFLSSVSKYIGNLDPIIRRIGMAVAEYVAKLSNRKLDFGDWDGDTQGRMWIRDIRALLDEADGFVKDAAPDSDDEDEDDDALHTTVDPLISTPASEPQRPPKTRQTPVYDSDDSLSGYASSSSSSRAPSPTSEELDEIEKDPTLRSGGGLNKKKVIRPVYLADLAELLRPTKAGEQDEYEKLDVGLQHAEELIRRKRDYGTELGGHLCTLSDPLFPYLFLIFVSSSYRGKRSQSYDYFSWTAG
jgi:telomere length regulation protein